MKTTQTSTIASIDSRSAWRKTDTMWMLGPDESPNDFYQNH
ncbi:serine transporter [Salmonella enterica subsp. enterica serovar Typhi]|nr:serine transporter [Salmonella enterica subsp. enterica serovar Typhi]CGD74345.1 serine transporter [Salmonella enterica subsp. enterica serovar Typhi]CIC93999.1 serine transporter [Salmonella enterica subsp. enterica serovar Typhi]